MRKFLRLFTATYQDQPLDLLRKAQTLTILCLVFLVLAVMFLGISLLATGGLTQDARMMLFLIAGLVGILALIRTGMLNLSVYLYIGMVFVIFSLVVFLSTGRDILKIYNLGILLYVRPAAGGAHRYRSLAKLLQRRCVHRPALMVLLRPASARTAGSRTGGLI
jgi:hypothetical protein